MSREPVEVLVAVHVNRPQDRSVLVSIDGDNRKAEWIPRSETSSLELLGTHTNGTDRDDNTVRLPLANIQIPEWLAKKKGFI